jgi:hypothetical protein
MGRLQLWRFIVVIASMSEYRNSPADTAMPGRQPADYHIVPMPERSDGVGLALRRAFGPGAKTRHDDFADLLRRIDQATWPCEAEVTGRR